MGNMKNLDIIKIIESTLKVKIETKIELLIEFNKIEAELKINIDIFAKKKQIYFSKMEYVLHIEFIIESETKGYLKDQHQTLRKSMLYCDKNKKEEEIIKIVEELKIPCKIKNAVNLAKYYVYEQFKYYKMDQISREEYNILETVGMKAKLYAEPCSFVDFYDYDLNSMYSYLLNLKKFRFPITAGKWETIETIDKTKLGIYKLRILSDVDRRIFMENDAYTNYDIEYLDYLGYEYELADNKAYIYDKYLTGDNYFGYLKGLYDMRKEHPIIKVTMISTWGICAKRNILKLKVNIEDEEGENPEIKQYENKGYEIKKYDIHNNKCELENLTLNPFKFDLARLSYFLTSYGRCYLGRIVSQDEIKESLVYIHTDGFRCALEPKDIDYRIDNKMGGLKFAKLTGKFTLRKLNSILFFNEITKELELYNKDEFKDYIKKLN